MRPVAEIQWVTGGIQFWQGYDATNKVDLSSHAFLTSGGWILTDPIALANEPFTELTQSKISGIILTNANHERAAAEFRQRCGIPIIAHPDSKVELSLEVDRWISDGDTVFGLAVIHLPGFARGEMALYSPEGDGLMIVGDAVINLESSGFSVLPAKYCSNPREAKASLQKLLQFPFEVMTFAHGLPMTGGARQKLESLLR